MLHCDPSLEMIPFQASEVAELTLKLPQKIFTVQDEPPTWDDDTDAGLESVSEPDLDDLRTRLDETDLAEEVERDAPALADAKMRGADVEVRTRLESGTTVRRRADEDDW